MFLTAGTKKIIYLIAFLFLFSQAAFADDQNAVSFSGKVKKVIVKKNKVAVKDPVTKKRFTLIINEQTKMTGWKGLPDIKKGDSISGKYIVTDKGLYVARELTGK
jgi:hypothetical protein